MWARGDVLLQCDLKGDPYINQSHSVLLSFTRLAHNKHTCAHSQDYWRQLGRLALWQAGVWLFGLLIVAMMIAARSKREVRSVAAFLAVGAGGKFTPPTA